MRLSEMGVSSWGSTGHFPGGGAGSSRDTLIFFFGRERKSFLGVYISLGKALLAIGCRATLLLSHFGEMLQGERRGKEGGEDKIEGPSGLRSNYPA